MQYYLGCVMSEVRKALHLKCLGLMVREKCEPQILGSTIRKGGGWGGGGRGSKAWSHYRVESEGYEFLKRGSESLLQGVLPSLKI